jgi:hypothetical protein
VSAVHAEVDDLEEAILQQHDLLFRLIDLN